MIVFTLSERSLIQDPGITPYFLIIQQTLHPLPASFYYNKFQIEAWGLIFPMPLSKLLFNSRCMPVLNDFLFLMLLIRIMTIFKFKSCVYTRMDGPFLRLDHYHGPFIGCYTFVDLLYYCDKLLYTLQYNKDENVHQIRQRE